jgi:hypothetical protein
MISLLQRVLFEAYSSRFLFFIKQIHSLKNTEPYFNDVARLIKFIIFIINALLVSTQREPRISPWLPCCCM